MKANYYRLARIHHPDRVGDTEKTTATEKFHMLHTAYSILADPETKKIYDAGGSHSLFRKSTIAAKWKRYIRTIDSTDIDYARKNYQGSVNKKNDIFREVIIGKGSITHLFNTIPFMRYEDENRIIEIVKDGVKTGELPKILIRKMRSSK